MTDFVKLVGSLDDSSHVLLYKQLQQGLRNAILRHVLTEDDAIPAERDLAEAFGISRITVRKALEGLVDEGFLVRRPGSGTFVAPRVEKVFSKLSSFSEDMRARGRTSHSQWINRAQGMVTPEEAMIMGLSPNTLVYRFHRIRYADDVSMALEYSTIPGFALQSIDSVEDSLYLALELSGFKPHRALQRLRSVTISDEHALLLNIPMHSPCLLIERSSFGKDGRAVEYTKSWYRGDSYDFVAELIAS